MNNKNYNDYDFVKEHPTLNVERFENYDIPLDLSKDTAMLEHKFAIQIGNLYDKEFVNAIKEYVKKNNINSATIIDEKSLLDTLMKASKYEAMEKALDLIKQKLINVSRDYIKFRLVDTHNRVYLKGEIDAYFDCIEVIKKELGMKEENNL